MHAAICLPAVHAKYLHVILCFCLSELVLIRAGRYLHVRTLYVQNVSGFLSFYLNVWLIILLAALPDHPLLYVALLVVLTLHACLLPVVAVQCVQSLCMSTCLWKNTSLWESTKFLKKRKVLENGDVLEKHEVFWKDAKFKKKCRFFVKCAIF